MNDFIRRDKKYSDKPIVRIEEYKETVEQFLARGGEIQKIPIGVSNLDEDLFLPKNLARSARNRHLNPKGYAKVNNGKR